MLGKFNSLGTLRSFPAASNSYNVLHCLQSNFVAGLRRDGLSSALVRHSSLESSVILPLSPLVILTLRTWAVWSRDRRLSIGLPIFFVICYLPMAVIVVMFLRSLESELQVYAMVDSELTIGLVP